MPIEGGELIRVDPLTIIEGTMSAGGKIVPFMPDNPEDDWNGDLVNARKPFITADRCRHDLSRLQARTLHRVVRSRTASTWSPS